MYLVNVEGQGKASLAWR